MKSVSLIVKKYYREIGHGQYETNVMRFPPADVFLLSNRSQKCMFQTLYQRIRNKLILLKTNEYTKC